jgi:hypothetical protein
LTAPCGSSSSGVPLRQLRDFHRMSRMGRGAMRGIRSARSTGGKVVGVRAVVSDGAGRDHRDDPRRGREPVPNACAPRLRGAAARPPTPAGGWTEAASSPLRAITQAITEFEFRISPVPSSTPDRSGNLRDHVEHAPGAIRITCQSQRALHRLGDVRDVSTEPQPDLVAKDPKSARPAAADGTTSDNAPLAAARVRGRRLLDHTLPGSGGLSGTDRRLDAAAAGLPSAS